MLPLNFELSSGNCKTEYVWERKNVRTHTHIVPERRTASRPSKYTAWFLSFFSIPFTAAAAYALSSFSLSLSYTMESYRKKVKKTKITIHHRPKKKNGGFLTNNNDRHVTNMNSFFFSSLLFVFYYIRILKRKGIRQYCLLKCIDKYIEKMHEMVIACGVVQNYILLRLPSQSLFFSLTLLSITLRSITWMCIRVWRRQVQRKKENYTPSRVCMWKKVVVVRRRQWCLECSHWKERVERATEDKTNLSSVCVCVYVCFVSVCRHMYVLLLPPYD
jgi:hypothetical protein